MMTDNLNDACQNNLPTATMNELTAMITEESSTFSHSLAILIKAIIDIL